MPVAEVPGQPRERGKIGRARLDQWFGFRHHLDQAAVIQHQRVVGAQPHRVGKVKLDAGPLDAKHEAFLCLPLCEWKNERVEDGGSLPLGSR